MSEAPTLYDVHARCLRVLELVAPVLGKDGPLTPHGLQDMLAVEAHLRAALRGVTAVLPKR